MLFDSLLEGGGKLKIFFISHAYVKDAFSMLKK